MKETGAFFMTNKIISHETNKSRKLNEYLQGLRNLYKDDTANVIQLCYELGATYEQVGNALGITRAEAFRQYPKSTRKENHGK